MATLRRKFKPYSPSHWYWDVGTIGVWSSKAADYIDPATDSDYAAWEADGGRRGKSVSEAALAEILTAQGLEARAPIAVPKTITPYQARVVLTAAGLRDIVEAAVAAADATTKDAWEYATVIERDSPFIVGMGTLLNLTVEQIDTLFLMAASIEGNRTPGAITLEQQAGPTLWARFTSLFGGG